MQEEKKLAGEFKMYVWDDVLEDYTTGGVAVHARSIDEALALIEAEDEYAIDECKEKSPTIYPLQGCLVVWGGG